MSTHDQSRSNPDIVYAIAHMLAVEQGIACLHLNTMRPDAVDKDVADLRSLNKQVQGFLGFVAHEVHNGSVVQQPGRYLSNLRGCTFCMAVGCWLLPVQLQALLVSL